MEIEIKMVDGEKIRMNARNYVWNTTCNTLVVFSEEVDAYESYSTVYNTDDVIYVSPACALHEGGQMYDL